MTEINQEEDFTLFADLNSVFTQEEEDGLEKLCEEVIVNSMY